MAGWPGYLNPVGSEAGREVRNVSTYSLPSNILPPLPSAYRDKVAMPGDENLTRVRPSSLEGLGPRKKPSVFL